MTLLRYALQYCQEKKKRRAKDVMTVMTVSRHHVENVVSATKFIGGEK